VKTSIGGTIVIVEIPIDQEVPSRDDLVDDLWNTFGSLS